MTVPVTISPTIEFATGERSDPGASLHAPSPARVPLSCGAKAKVAHRLIKGRIRPTRIIPGYRSGENFNRRRKTNPHRLTNETVIAVRRSPQTLPNAPCLFQDRSSSARAVDDQVPATVLVHERSVSGSHLVAQLVRTHRRHRLLELGRSGGARTVPALTRVNLVTSQGAFPGGSRWYAQGTDTDNRQSSTRKLQRCNSLENPHQG